MHRARSRYALALALFVLLLLIHPVMAATQTPTQPDWMTQMLKHSKKGSVEAGNAMRESFKGRAPNASAPATPASKGAVQDAFEREAIQRALQQCPQRFAEYRDGPMVEFRKCTAHFGANCKSKQHRPVAVCNQGALDECRNIIDSFFTSRCGVGSAAKTTVKKVAICNETAHQERTSDGASCQCGQLYTMNAKLKSCVFSGSRGLSLSTDSADALETQIEKLTADQSGTVELKLRNGTTITLGVIRLPNGRYLFTPDGEHYQESPSDALAPGFLKSVGTSLSDLSKSFKGFFGVGKYVGPKDETHDGQLLTDAANSALENLQADANPNKKVEAAQEIMEQWLNRGKNILGGQYEEQFLEEMKTATGVDVVLLKKILAGDVAGIGSDLLQKVYTFPAQTVIILGSELRSANFTNAARLYARERATGKTPAQIMALVQNGQLPELDFVSNIKGVSPQFARGSLLLGYEEAYQRYELAKKLKSQRK